MGLDAGVRCRCWEEGETKPFAHELIMSEGRLMPKSSDPKLDAEFFAWEATACPHERQWIAREWISNWDGVRDFKRALDAFGPFDVLIREIPDVNGGFTEPREAEHCLQELDRFLATRAVAEQAWLVTDDGARVDGEGAFHFFPVKRRLFGGWMGQEMGVDRDGFYIRDDARELFRSKHFEQTKRGERDFSFRDLSSGAVFVTKGGAGLYDTPPDKDGRCHASYPRFLRVEIIPYGPEEYRGLVDRLRTVFAASVATGNPVLWF